MKKVIFNLSILVDTVIHEAMSEFKIFGKKAKEMQADNKPEKEILEIYSFMAKIYEDLSPFEPRLRELYPNMEELFDIFSASKRHNKK